MRTCAAEVDSRALRQKQAGWAGGSEDFEKANGEVVGVYDHGYETRSDGCSGQQGPGWNTTTDVVRWLPRGHSGAERGCYVQPDDVDDPASYRAGTPQQKSEGGA